VPFVGPVLHCPASPKVEQRIAKFFSCANSRVFKNPKPHARVSLKAKNATKIKIRRKNDTAMGWPKL
jgi:hypothetical protein